MFTASAVVAVILTLVVIGVVIWAVNTLIPMDERIRKLINVVLIIFAVLVVVGWLLGWTPATFR